MYTVNCIYARVYAHVYDTVVKVSNVVRTCATITHRVCVCVYIPIRRIYFCDIFDFRDDNKSVLVRVRGVNTSFRFSQWDSVTLTSRHNAQQYFGVSTMHHVNRSTQTKTNCNNGEHGQKIT